MFKKGDIVEIKGEEYEIVDVKSEFSDKPMYELIDRNKNRISKIGDAFMVKVRNIYWSNGAGDLHHGGFEDLEEEDLPEQLKAICPWFRECEFGCMNYLFEKNETFGIVLEFEWDPTEHDRDDFIKIGETKTAIDMSLVDIMKYPVIVELIPPEDDIIGYILRIFIPTDRVGYEDYHKIGKKVEEILDALW